LFRRACIQQITYPREYRRNFFLLYLDNAFFGVLNGSTTLVLLGVYASRLGANPAEIGALTATSVIMNSYQLWG
jgi:hypothetical protein